MSLAVRPMLSNLWNHFSAWSGVAYSPFSSQSQRASETDAVSSHFGKLIPFIAIICFFAGSFYSSDGGAVLRAQRMIFWNGPQYDSSYVRTSYATPMNTALPFYSDDSLSRLGDSQVIHQRRVADVSNRKKVKIFIGIFTTPSLPDDKYGKRREAIRDTYMSNVTAILDTDVKFVAGRSTDRKVAKAFDLEVRQDPERYLHLDMQECYKCLPTKTATFFMTVYENYDADWVFKIDDDVYLVASRLQAAVDQYNAIGAGYVGCMKLGTVHMAKSSKWYEPAWRLLPSRNTMNAYGSIYGVSKNVLNNIIVPNLNMFRLIANEDTTVGQWLIAFNITFFEDMRLCSTQCRVNAVAILDNSCSGLCNPVQELYECHNNRQCQRPVNDPVRMSFQQTFLNHEYFERVEVYADYSAVRTKGKDPVTPNGRNFSAALEES